MNLHKELKNLVKEFEKSNPKGVPFRANIIKSGLIGLKEKGQVGILPHIELMKSIPTTSGIPLFIQHNDYSKYDEKTIKTLKDKISGKLIYSNFNADKGWVEVIGLAYTDKAIELLKTNPPVSTTYQYNRDDTKGTDVAIDYDFRVLDPVMVDLCIVDTPRYEGAYGEIIVNEVKCDLKCNSYSIGSNNFIENYMKSSFEFLEGDLENYQFPIAKDEITDDIYEKFLALSEKEIAEDMELDYESVEVALQEKDTIKNAKGDPLYIIVDGVPMRAFYLISIYKKYKLGKNTINNSIINLIANEKHIDIFLNDIKSVDESAYKYISFIMNNVLSDNLVDISNVESFLKDIISNRVIPANSYLTISGVRVLVQDIINVFKNYKKKMEMSSKLSKSNNNKLPGKDGNNDPKAPIKEKPKNLREDKKMKTDEMKTNPANQPTTKNEVEKDEVEKDEVEKAEDKVETQSNAVSGVSLEDIKKLIVSAVNTAIESKTAQEKKQVLVNSIYDEVEINRQEAYKQILGNEKLRSEGDILDELSDFDSAEIGKLFIGISKEDN